MEKFLDMSEKGLWVMNKFSMILFYILAILYCILTLSLLFGFREPKYELQETIYGLKWLGFLALAKTYENEK